MWKSVRLGLILFLTLTTLSPPSLKAEEFFEYGLDEIQICNSPTTTKDQDCQATSCMDQCLKEDGLDAEECQLSCNIST